nr:MAG: ORF1 [Torque teno midi virus]
MPFWWKRRRRPWYGRFKRRRRFQRYKRRPRRRYATRRGRRAPRRRYRRRKKVRKKLKKITIKQWQPESITRCKILGYSNLILGAEGRQFFCWTEELEQYIPPKAPGGGGFGYELITLQWLYQQYRAHNNTWTRTNKNKDLCRYTGCTIIFYRHQYTDFIVAYNIQPPFEINKFTFPDMQPQNLLLRPHKIVIPSLTTKPTGKRYVKVKIKPPKQLSTKWFFQKEMADIGLVQLQGSACSLLYPRIGPKSQSQMVTIFYLNTDFYPFPNWGASTDHPWRPYPSKAASQYEFFSTTDTSKTGYKLPTQHPHGIESYYESVNKDTGWFNPKVLTAKAVKVDNVQYGSLPINYARYNPNEDTGIGNSVYCISVLQNKYKPPATMHDYIINGQPLWMALYGFWNWLIHTSRDKGLMQHYMFVIESPAIKPVLQTGTQTKYPIIDPNILNGKLPFDEVPTSTQIQNWYPTAYFQTATINSLVESGPYIPKYTNIPVSTWELSYKYKFYFKWGGPQVQDQPVDDPKYQRDYPWPNLQQQTVEISNPQKLSTESMLHSWDYRRGFIKQTALKRMSEYLETDTDFQSDESGTPKKRKKITKKIPCPQEKQEKIQKCLQQLCEENTSQETPENLQQLIQHQQQQQQQLKSNILYLLTHLKKQQQYLGLQTGHLN